MGQEYPDFVARFYDTVYAQVRDGVDNDYYLEQIAHAGGPVLEIGVGTGRLFAEALRRGADIDGVDLSAAMLERASAKLAAADRRRLYLQDAIHLALARRYTLILAPFRVLSHVPAVADQLRLLDAVHAHLVPGGHFLFDLYVPEPRLLAEGMEDKVDFDGEYAPGRRLRRSISARSDIVNQTTRVRMDFTWEEEDGGERHGEWWLEMRFFFRYEIEHLVARSPLVLEAFKGDFQGGALSEESKEFVVVCRREGG
jgi:SAM-dependent methyltransferase